MLLSLPGIDSPFLVLPLFCTLLYFQLVLFYQLPNFPTSTRVLFSPGELFEYLGRSQEALAAFRRGHAYRWVGSGTAAQ